MPKVMKNIDIEPLNKCPLCKSIDVEIVHGNKGLFRKQPDSIRCGNCEANYKIDDTTEYVNFEKIPSPYGFFEKNFEGWVKISDSSRLADMIVSNNPEGLNYLSGAYRYMWRLRILLNSKGDARPGNLELRISWDDPNSVNEARKQLTEFRQLQKEIRQVKKEMNLDMKEIRAKYGRKKEYQSAKNAALAPYEKTNIAIDSLLVNLDRVKINIQDWIDEH
jgi:hypothetical protein